MNLRPDMRVLISRHPRVAAIAAAPPIGEFDEGTLIAVEMSVRAAGLRESVDSALLEEALAAVAAGSRGELARPLRDALDNLAESLAHQAAQAMHGYENIDHPEPDTEWGRLMMKHHAVKALVEALAEDAHEAFVLALRHASTVAASTRKQNDDYRLLRLIEALGFYVFNGYNSI
ncbi:hypothetical protein [Nonomuraea basaltis]|uniref:hypothetical protein n=1 Tax=Nonomuraea basaltis TaxID=2495887 RepID=UPI00110C6EBF|nr:hypothetical protein [Nonomuraea basaltis]TMR90786.1 hypothetical protein EJK15_53465 [Nonomuraea basaltis]